VPQSRGQKKILTAKQNRHTCLWTLRHPKTQPLKKGGGEVNTDCSNNKKNQIYFLFIMYISVIFQNLKIFFHFP
jgi:hypothetical protein